MSKLIREAKLETVTRGQIVMVSFLVILFVSYIALFVVGLGSDLGEAIGVSFSVLGLPFLLALGAIFFLSWIKTFTTVQIFEDRVEVLGRFLVKSSRRIEASKIESVDFTESLLGRQRYGGLTVRGSGVGAIVVSPIQLPEEIAEVIRGIADKSISKNGKSNSDYAAGDTQSLAELIKMKEKGHLTDAEFTAAKKKLLD
jgi:hypothetical protein